ncbi:hypothetical protein [Thermomonospora catenispora]|uniref:hypothetical protein n=1 Tax=Thermomonospora catenispora TaxID=2493090 RepID=UPI0011228540|nr:hypothetical protein [Thermomonospora catenispora]TNY36387.1 hypothetical protein EIO00_13840 [Thermomonospora catenispora]
MGYDMWYEVRFSGEKEAVADALASLQAALRERDALRRHEAERLRAGRPDPPSGGAHGGRTERYRAAQEKVDAAYAALREAERSHFRLNVRGMERYRKAMAALGMAFESDPPDWPGPEEFGLTREQVQAAGSPGDHPGLGLTEEQKARAAEHRAAVERVLAWHGETDAPGIPLHKFSSNDGWLVLPDECRAAVKAWEEYVADKGEETAMTFVAEHTGDPDHWLAWIDYLRVAVERGGFRVW